MVFFCTHFKNLKSRLINTHFTFTLHPTLFRHHSKVGKRFSNSLLSYLQQLGSINQYLQSPLSLPSQGSPVSHSWARRGGAIWRAPQVSGSCFMLTMIALVLAGAFFWCLAHAAKGDGEQFQSSPRCPAPGWGPQQWGRTNLWPRRAGPGRPCRLPGLSTIKNVQWRGKRLKCGAI